MVDNAEKLYSLIKKNSEQTQALFRQALQDPNGALQEICEFGESVGLPVTPEEVKAYLATLEDPDTQQWVVKARGGL